MCFLFVQAVLVVAFSILLPRAVLASASGRLVISITDSKGRLLEEAVVFLIPQQKEIADKAKTADRQFEIAQKNKEFQPSVLAVQTGSTIRFPNLDEVKHNVYSFSPAQNIDIPLYSSSEKKIPEQKFEKPGIVVIGCKIHDWMISYIYVVDSPYFAVSKNGLAQTEKVPFG